MTKPHSVIDMTIIGRKELVEKILSDFSSSVDENGGRIKVAYTGTMPKDNLIVHTKASFEKWVPASVELLAHRLQGDEPASGRPTVVFTISGATEQLIF